MKISVNWMQRLAGESVQILPKGGIDELVKKIGAQLGAVEEVIDVGKRYQGIIIAKVVTCIKHPNADKLHVCKIDDGGKAKNVERDKDGYVQVVCGAPNVREGLLVAWLPPGSTVPASVDKDPFVLEARELRGVVSNGMLASAAELAISDDHTGILEINNVSNQTKKDSKVDINDHVAAFKNIVSVPKYKPGDDFAEALELNDSVIDIENKMFTHRPDLFGQLGVAREIAGITGQKFTSPKGYTADKKTLVPKLTLDLNVENKAGALVPRFVAQVFEDIQVKASPVWMQTYLMRVGIRPINNIVDITNYFMIQTSQPLHAYDYDKLLKVSGLKSASLESRMSKKGEKLKLLNGKEITFDDDTTILITSGDVPVGIAGVIGGADTEVDENTKHIVLECATFDMYSIRKTSMKYGLFTDAVTRFNKGQSPLQNSAIVAWVSGDIICEATGQPGKMCDVGTPKSPKMVRVNASFINARLGLDLPAHDMQKLLENVEFDIERTDNKDELKVTPPFWRTDIEIPEDVVEEVGRLYGFDHLPLVLPMRDLTPTDQDATLAFKQRVREILAKGGANEVLTYSFVHGDLIDKAGQDKKDAFELSNAISPDLQYYRLSLTPSLLDKVHMNIKSGHDQFAIFELNKTHVKGQNDPDDKNVPKEHNNLALVIARSEKSESQGAAYYEAKNYLDYVASNLGITFHYEPITETPTYPAGQPFDHTRSARVYMGDKIIGLVGEYKSSVRRALKLPVHTAGFEIATSALVGASGPGYTQLSKYPNAEQDISLKVPASATYKEVFDVLAGELLGNADLSADITPLDIYQREGDTKHKQMTFRFTVASYDKTLKREEVSAMLDKAAEAAIKKLKAERL